MVFPTAVHSQHYSFFQISKFDYHSCELLSLSKMKKSLSKKKDEGESDDDD